MTQVVYRSDPGPRGAQRQPRDAEEAIAWLNEGNRRFVSLGTTGEQGEQDGPSFVIDVDLSPAPEQRPFGIVLGCADARVPIELVFGQAANRLFVVRVAGNTIGADGLGSIAYAVDHFPSVRVIVVLGHVACGAVAAAVGGFQKPYAFLDLAASLPLRSLVDRTMAAVRASDHALRAVHADAVGRLAGYESALLDLSVTLNAAYTAYSLSVDLSRGAGPRIPVVWGIYDLATRTVGIPGGAASGLGPPPADAEEFRSLAMSLATLPSVVALLGNARTKE